MEHFSKFKNLLSARLSKPQHRFPSFWNILPLFFASLFGLFLLSDSDLYIYLSRLPPNAFSNKVVWITGASSGIGAQLAVDVTKAGGQVVMSARRIQQLEEVSSKCSFVGKTPFILPLDVLDFDSHQKAYHQIISRFGKVDLLVLNAGQSQRNLAVDTPLSDTESLMRLNFLSSVSIAKTVLPFMIERGSGQICVISSLSGKIGTPIASSYSASKFALHGYFDTLRTEVSHLGLSVSLVCPGPVETEIAAHTLRNPNNPVQEEGKKMSVERFSTLLMRGLHHKVNEMWIADQPFLLTTYINVYLPWLSRYLFTHFIGPARVAVLKSGVGNIFDIQLLLGVKKTQK